MAYADVVGERRRGSNGEFPASSHGVVEFHFCQVAGGIYDRSDAMLDGEIHAQLEAAQFLVVIYRHHTQHQRFRTLFQDSGGFSRFSHNGASGRSAGIRSVALDPGCRQGL